MLTSTCLWTQLGVTVSTCLVYSDIMLILTTPPVATIRASEWLCLSIGNTHLVYFDTILINTALPEVTTIRGASLLLLASMSMLRNTRR